MTDDITSQIKTIDNKSGISKELHLGFTVNFRQIKDDIYIPGYYDPEISLELVTLEKSGKFDIITLEELVKKSLISIKRGNEVGSQFYGLGDIPFVRTSDIVNWEIKADPVKSLPEEVYLRYKKSQNIQTNDILFVSDGTFLIGRVALVTKFDQKLVIQSHLRRIRCLKPEEFHPFLLLYFNVDRNSSKANCRKNICSGDYIDIRKSNI